MSPSASEEIRSIVFDLDGTLYVSGRYAAEIQDTSVAYIAGLKNISQSEAVEVMSTAWLKRAEESGTTQTISAVCAYLGGSVQGLHRFFADNLRPEAYLVRDQRVIGMLQRLAERFSLFIYTNNNRILTTRIMNLLGLDGLMRGTFTIDDTWCGKPDEGMVQRVLGEIGLSPEEVLFVGDRYDVDLRVPELLGCPVYLSQSLEQLLRLEELLIPSEGSSAAPAYPPAAPS